MTVTPNPLEGFLASGGTVILDGGLATELEAAGFDLDHPLWSARLLREAPQAIASVHRAYLEAGADCITTASYQASIPAFRREGLTLAEAERLLEGSVTLAVEVRDAFWSEAGNRAGRRRPLVAASVGPYGAYLANGAEYSGDYDLDVHGLREFHADRFRRLAGAGADLLACETIPSAAEAGALCGLLAQARGTLAWLSFSCRDAERICDGTRFADVVDALAPLPQIVALGVNCTAPEHVVGLLQAAAAVTDKPLVAYPNSGERYEPRGKTWTGAAASEAWGALGVLWRDAGARLVGGCCRTGPAHIRSLRQTLAV